MPETTYIRAITSTLAAAMRADERVFVLGEDVAEGGPYLATEGLAEEFGRDRVLNTPISEGVGPWLNNLALLLQSTDRLTEAEPLLLEAYAGCCDILGDSHENTRIILENLVATYRGLKNDGKAKQYQKLLEVANAKAKLKP